MPYRADATNEGKSHAYVCRHHYRLRAHVGGVYGVDHRSSGFPLARPMVNWEGVVAKNIDDITAAARDGWKKIAADSSRLPPSANTARQCECGHQDGLLNAAFSGCRSAAEISCLVRCVPSSPSISRVTRPLSLT